METIHNLETSIKNQKAELIKSSIERLRKKLLDLTRRNNLINFRETRRTIKILNNDVDTLYKRLVLENKSIDLSPLENTEEEKEHISGNKSSENPITATDRFTSPQQQNIFSSTRQLNLPTQFSSRDEKSYFEILKKCDLTKHEIKQIQSKYDWEVISWKEKYEIFRDIYEKTTISNQVKLSRAENIININDYKNEKILQTNLLPQNLERRSKNILQHWKTGIEETGINFLYLSIGFLKWFEASHSNESYLSPIILIPLRIERTRLNRKTKCYTYSVGYSGEDIESNTSALERLKSDFGLVIPNISDDLIPSSYLSDLVSIISSKKRWEIKNDIHISFYSFANIRLYKDLDEKFWPSSNLPSKNFLIQTIIHGKEAPSSEPVIFGEVIDTDNLDTSKKLPIVLDADSSQLSAVNQCVYSEKSMVIVGPPGTGKSQTITNLIAAALMNKKSVLFVSEKKAALEVVRKRLDSIGLGDFCLELHSHKTQKGQLHKDIGIRLNAKYTESQELDIEISRYQQEREKLRNYYLLLTEKCSNTNYNNFEILWKSERWLNEIKGDPVTIDFFKPLLIDQIKIDNFTNLLQDFCSVFNQIPSEVIEYWFGFTPSNLQPGNEIVIREKINDLLKSSESLNKIIGEVTDSLNGNLDDTLGNVYYWSKVDLSVIDEREPNWNNELIHQLHDENVLKKLQIFIRLVGSYYYHKNEFEKGYVSLKNYSLINLKKIYKIIKFLVDIGHGGKTINDIKSVIDKTNKIIEISEKIKLTYEKLIDFYVVPPKTVNDYLKILELYDLFKSVPPAVTLNPYPNHSINLAMNILMQARDISDNILNELNEFAEYFDTQNLPDYQCLSHIIKILQSNNTWIKKLFSKDYRDAKKETCIYLYDKKFLKDKKLITNLNKLREIIKKSEDFQNSTHYQSILGPLFKGINSDWGNLAEAIKFCQDINSITESERISKNILNDLSEIKEKINILFPKALKNWKLLLETAKTFEIKISKDHQLDKLLSDLKNHHKVLNKCYEQLPINDNAPLLVISKLFTKFRSGVKALEILDSIENDESLPNILGSLYDSVYTDIVTLREYALMG